VAAKVAEKALRRWRYGIVELALWHCDIGVSILRFWRGGVVEAQS